MCLCNGFEIQNQCICFDLLISDFKLHILCRVQLKDNIDFRNNGVKNV